MFILRSLPGEYLKTFIKNFQKITNEETKEIIFIRDVKGLEILDSDAEIINCLLKIAVEMYPLIGQLLEIPCSTNTGDIFIYLPLDELTYEKIKDILIRTPFKEPDDLNDNQNFLYRRRIHELEIPLNNNIYYTNPYCIFKTVNNCCYLWGWGML